MLSYLATEARCRHSTLLKYSHFEKTKKQLVLVQRRACHKPTIAEKILQGHKYKGQVGGFHPAKHCRLGVIRNVSDAGI